MTTIKIDDSYVVVRKDGRVRREGKVYIIESAEEYAARRFEEVDNRLKRIEEEQKAIKEELEKLRMELKNR